MTFGVGNPAPLTARLTQLDFRTRNAGFTSRPATVWHSATSGPGGTALTLAWSHPISARASVLTEGGRYRAAGLRTAPPRVYAPAVRSLKGRSCFLSPMGLTIEAAGARGA